MIKNNNLAFFALFCIGLFSLFSINISAQNKVVAQTQPTNATDKVLQNYINISALSMDERRTFFNEKLSPEDRANIFKFHLAFQFVKRPNLTKEQKDLILETISMIKSDSYDEKKPQKRTEAQQEAKVLEMKIKQMFLRKEGYEIFASLGGTKEDAEILQKYLEVSTLPSLSERRDLFANSTPLEKSNYWRIHLANSFVKFSELDKQQKEIILEVIAIAKPESYQLQINSSEWIEKVDKPLKTLSINILALFSKEIGVKIFLELGGETSQLLANACNCSQGSIPACWDEYCVNNRCEKKPGCGIIWLSECNGRC